MNMNFLLILVVHLYLFQGFGVIKYNDGSTVEGRWKNGKRHDNGQWFQNFQNSNRDQELTTADDDFI